MSSHALRIAYFGLPLGALVLARAGFVPHLVAVQHTDAPGARRVQKRLGERARILERPDLTKRAAREAIAEVAPDVLLSWFWPKRIPSAVLALAPRGAFGVHPSLLPRWRGPDPYFWALYSGDRETGVTLHRLESEYDTGAVIAQTRVAIAPRENAWQLAKRLDRPSLALLVDCARRLTAGERLAGSPQDPQRVTSAPPPDEALLAIDWQRSAEEIVRLVRAAAPYPGASATLGDETVDVLEAEPLARALPRALEPADAVWTEDGLAVRAGDVGVRITRVRRDDDSVLEGAALKALFPGGLAQLPD